jgi:hypothetical protein
MQTARYEEVLNKRGLDQESLQEAIAQVSGLEAYLKKANVNLDQASDEDLNGYMRYLIGDGSNTISHLLNLARYYYAINQQDTYIYFTALLGGIGVIENIKKRLLDICGQEKVDEVFGKLNLPPLGTPIDDIPSFTKELMVQLETNLSKEIYQKVLAGNNHQLPREAMLAEKEAYELADSLDVYLKERHQRKIAELTKHFEEDRVWFEQKITPEVIDFVSSNQEVLSGIREGDKLYITKIPYDTVKFLNAKTDVEKRYHACHCSFAKKSILTEDVVPGDWCYCSAGFAKFPFEVILDRELEIELLASPLLGDNLCRFVIDLKE